MEEKRSKTSKKTKNIQTIVLTGGPCAGKTTAFSYIQNYMTKLGWLVLFVDKAATQQMQNGFSTKLLSELDFQTMLTKTQHQKQKIALEYAKKIKGYDNILIVCDRGICDNQAYMDNGDYMTMLHSIFDKTKSEIFGFYGAVFHMVSAADGAEEFYTTNNNKARSETLEEARELDRMTRTCWIGHPHFRVIKNGCSFEEKLQKLMQEVTSFLGVPQPREIERKWLIEMPNLAKLDEMPNCQRVQISQTYLIAKNSEERRVRQRGFGGGYIYTETTKWPTKDDAVRIETERPLSKSEYLDLLMQADPELKPLRKTRYCLDSEDGQYFEIDVYPFWDKQAILELELNSTDEEPKIPNFLKVIREVTGEDAYKNHALASAVPSED